MFQDWIAGRNTDSWKYDKISNTDSWKYSRKISYLKTKAESPPPPHTHISPFLDHHPIFLDLFQMAIVYQGHINLPLFWLSQW